MSRYKPGDWLAVCDVCGKEVYASSLRKRWDGFMVCRKDWEPRHPQDFVRGSVDTQVPSWTRPEPADTFIDVENPSAIAGIAVAGEAIPGLISAAEPPPAGTFTL